MLTARYTLRRNSKILLRYSSEDSKTNENDHVAKINNKKLNKEALEKIQSLLDGLKIVNKSSDNKNTTFARAPGIFKKQSMDLKYSRKNTNNIDSELSKAASKVAESLGDNVTESELMERVIHKIIPSKKKLSELISGMKVDHSKSNSNISNFRSRSIETIMKKKTDSTRTNILTRKQTKGLSDSKINIFQGKPLGIFKCQENEVNYGPSMDTWDKLEERELKLALSQPPSNYFEKMILWTEQGKIWKFPINNEQGLEMEENIHFSQHVFIDQHLEEWCPKRGPIRHFMELVCIGLSKNPFYTAQEKKDHIMWFKVYFESKKEILKEVGAFDSPVQENIA